MTTVAQTEEEMLTKAREKAENIIAQAEKRAERHEEKKEQMMTQFEEKMLARQEKLDEKLEQIEEEKQKYKTKQEEIEELKQEQMTKLEEVAKLSKEEAKDKLFTMIEEESNKEIKQFVDKFSHIKKEEADKEGAEIIARVLPRLSSDIVSEYSASTIDIPSEDFKGKLIGREGRNINFFEKTTGVEVIVDDTPLCVKVSSHDSEKRFVASETLRRLIKDGRINPHHIEKIYQDVAGGLDEILLEKGKEALHMLNIPMMKPEIVQHVGRFYLRSSYGQNLWVHSIEVAKMCEAIATEMGYDPLLAKKAGLLHDIGKVIAATGESHTAIGADTLRKYSISDIIVNAAESHHYDVPMTHAISWIVAAADAMSASRPGARFNTKDLFIEKMGELEKLISGIEGVQKVHIMQAGRDIMVYVDPTKVSDTELQKLLKTISIKVEEQLDYPGIIRISTIREQKLVEFLR
jgi:ribonucrease Y